MPHLIVKFYYHWYKKQSLLILLLQLICHLISYKNSTNDTNDMVHSQNKNFHIQFHLRCENIY